MFTPPHLSVKKARRVSICETGETSEISEISETSAAR